MSAILTYVRANELLRYDAATGLLIWKITCGVRVAGRTAGCLHKKSGRNRVGIDGKVYSVGRVAWLLMTGNFPANEIDHIDRDKANDRWVNLREATRSQNCMNRGKFKGSCHLKGVHVRPNGKYCSDIKVNGKHKHLHISNCPAAAYLAYVVASDKLHANYGCVE
jgi:hypothetical protein